MTATKTLNLIVGQAAIVKAIDSIANRGKKLDSDIQLAGLSVLDHIQQHGDVTLANRLFLALPKGARKLAMAEWFLAFGKLAANMDKATAKDMPFVFAKDKQTDLAGAQELPWYECKPEKAVADAFDVQAEVAKLLKRITAFQQAKPDAEIKGADLIAKLTALAGGAA